MQVPDHSRSDGLQAAGAQIMDTARKVLHEGNARRVSITRDGDVVAEFPLTFGVIGAVLAGALAADQVIMTIVQLEDIRADEQRLAKGEWVLLTSTNLIRPRVTPAEIVPWASFRNIWRGDDAPR
jgi:hypothetical protein